MFHYKCCHNILFLNKVLFKMKIKNTSLCSYCHTVDETIVHLFCECEVVKQLWADVKSTFSGLPFPDLTPKSAYFGFYELRDTLINHIHLIFRISVYSKRNAGSCSILYIKNKIKSIRKTEENLTYLSETGNQVNQRKWARCLIQS